MAALTGLGWSRASLCLTQVEFCTLGLPQMGVSGARLQHIVVRAMSEKHHDTPEAWIDFSQSCKSY